ncbi:uncharacterized protein cp110 [Pholidichthys leucotaenia]
MEDYDTFVQHCVSQLRKSGSEDEGQRRPAASSLIRFCGRPILPPLLSGKQRVEMRRHRDEVQKSSIHRTLKEDPRMSYVQTILHRVQLRKTPRLEELLQEAEMNMSSSSPLPATTEIDDLPLPPLTPTAYGVFFSPNVIPQQSYHEECLNNHLDSQEGLQPSSFSGASHQSLSSSFVTSEIGEIATAVTGRTDAGNFSEEVYNTGGFFLHSTSNTVAKMPDIISHPPIDGEELERSGKEVSFSDDFREVEDISCGSFQKDLNQQTESITVDAIEQEDKETFTTVLDSDKGEVLDRKEGSDTLLEKGDFSDNPSQTLSAHNCLTVEQFIQGDPKENAATQSQVDDTDSKPSEEPYRFSLQALLKKSQEYRRRQRMLRNQAKNTKHQERTQEQLRANVEEENGSDKENDRIPYKGMMSAEGKKTKEKKSTFIPSVETSPNKSWENKKMIEGEFTGKNLNVKSGNTLKTDKDGRTEEEACVEEEMMLRNNQLNTSEEKPTQISAFFQPASVSAGIQRVQDANTAFSKAARKYHTAPAPKFCRSPVLHKNKCGQSHDGGETSEGTLVGSPKSEETNIHSGVPSTSNLVVEGDVTSVLAKSSQHIDQLESNLSSLKVLISDLESTMKENLDDHSQLESSMQSELSFKMSPHELVGQNDDDDDDDHWEDQQRDDDDHDVEIMDEPKKQSLNSSHGIHQGLVPKISISGVDDLTVQDRGTETVNLSELRLVKIAAAEREKVKAKEGLTMGSALQGGCRKQPAKCVLSVAQQKRIPDVFRNYASSETTVPSDGSVLSDTSNRPVERRNQPAFKNHDCNRSPSLNQSYDVDMPSGLWLLEGSASDSSSHGHLVRERDQTPGGEGQGGVLRVKRRLLMHTSEETPDRRTDAEVGGNSLVRPNSSTPQVQWYEGQKDKRELLKQAHAAQIRTLQEQHRKQQEELLQALAVRYRLLQSLSFPCSTSNSRPEDQLTFSTLSQPCSPPPQHYRPLLSAAVKGFLTRRLLRTARVAQLVRVIRDTRQFLWTFQQQSSVRGELCSQQDLLLQNRVARQLCAARYEVYDIFFSLSARERMQLISWDRELAKERELRRQSEPSSRPRGKGSLSAATQKSLERKRGMMIQKKAAESLRGATTRTGLKSGSYAKQPPETKRGQFRTNPQRVPKSSSSSRPR